MPAKRPSPELPYLLSVCGKSEIDGFARRAVTHILSLEDPETPKDTPAWFQGVHRQIHFHDVESVEDARMMQAAAVTQAQVAEILRFGEECLKESRRRPVHSLIHCFAGASRSTAACYVIVAQILGPGRAGEALEFLLRIRPEAFPNLLVVRHADQLLGRHGELLRALAPLREAFSQALEEWVAGLGGRKKRGRTG